jgi:hypothetical protein
MTKPEYFDKIKKRTSGQMRSLQSKRECSDQIQSVNTLEPILIVHARFESKQQGKQLRFIQSLLSYSALNHEDFL